METLAMKRRWKTCNDNAVVELFASCTPQKHRDNTPYKFWSEQVTEDGPDFSWGGDDEPHTGLTV